MGQKFSAPCEFDSRAQHENISSDDIKKGGGGPYLTLRSAFRGGLPEGQFKIHPLLNYVVFRVPGQLLGGFPVK